MIGSTHHAPLKHPTTAVEYLHRGPPYARVLALVLALLPTLAFAQWSIPSRSSTSTVNACVVVDPARDDSARSYLSNAPFGADGFACANLGCRVRFAPESINANAYIYLDLFTGVLTTPGYFQVGAGASVGADVVQPRRSTVSLLLDGTHGVRQALQSAVGTCGSAEEPEGVRIDIAGSGASSTRTCKCVKDTAGQFRWLNTDTATRGTTTTDCPVSP